MKKLKKVLKIILIIILILVALILINAIRNYTIVRKLQKNIEEYLQSNNYHIEMTSDIGDNTKLTTNYYKKKKVLQKKSRVKLFFLKGERLLK